MRREWAHIFLLLGMLVGCDSRKGQPFQATLYDYDSWVVAAVETGTATGKVASYYFSRPFGMLEYAASADVGQTPVSVASFFGLRFVYIANSGSGSISVLSVDRTTGAFTPIQTVTGLTNISAVRTTVGSYLYAGYASGVQQYSVDSTTGQLTAVGSVVSFGGPVLRLELSPTHHALYVSRGSNTLYEASINASTGVLTPNNSYGYSVIEALSSGTNSNNSTAYLSVVDSSANSVSIYSISSATGFLTYVGSTSVTAPKSVTYLSGYSGLAIQSATGVVRTYVQASNGTLTLSNTYSTLSETALPFMNLSSDAGLALSLGVGGAAIWDVAPTSSGAITFTFRRRQSFSSVGQYANEFAPVSK